MMMMMMIRLIFIFTFDLQTFRTALGLKYACPSQSTWQLVMNSLMTVLSVGLPLARKNGKCLCQCC